MNDEELFVSRDELLAFITSLAVLDRELDALHVAWRAKRTAEIRAAQAVKDAAMREEILRERAERAASTPQPYTTEQRKLFPLHLSALPQKERRMVERAILAEHRRRNGGQSA